MLDFCKSRSIGLFAHYCRDNSIPYSVVVYVKELANYFGEVVVYTNERKLDLNPFEGDSRITLQMVKNEGYDFGMFYKFFHSIDVNKYDQIACVNDSNLLLKPLDCIHELQQDSTLDFWGIIDSYEKPRFSTHDENYHIQSHFIVFNRKAISELKNYFHTIDINYFLKETDPIIFRRKVINYWEIGVSQYLIQKGMVLATLMDSKELSEKYSIPLQKNMTFKLAEEMLQDGYPVLKRKVVAEQKRIELFFYTDKWLKKIIVEQFDLSFQLTPVVEELKSLRSAYQKQSLQRLISKIKRKLKIDRLQLLLSSFNFRRSRSGASKLLIKANGIGTLPSAIRNSLSIIFNQTK